MDEQFTGWYAERIEELQSWSEKHVSWILLLWLLHPNRWWCTSTFSTGWARSTTVIEQFEDVDRQCPACESGDNTSRTMSISQRKYATKIRSDLRTDLNEDYCLTRNDVRARVTLWPLLHTDWWQQRDNSLQYPQGSVMGNRKYAMKGRTDLRTES